MPTFWLKYVQVTYDHDLSIYLSMFHYHKVMTLYFDLNMNSCPVSCDHASGLPGCHNNQSSVAIITRDAAEIL